jgi:membrane fusion protein (multidrug efflux system)
MPRHRRILLFTLTTFALCTIPACKDPQTQKIPPQTPEVLVMEPAEREVTLYREWIGTLDGSENADIRARVTGHLISRNYQEGSLVKKGDVLFEIDPRPFQAALAEAMSQLEQGKAMQLASQSEADRSKELYDKKVIAEKEHTNKVQLNLSNVAKVKALESAVERAQLNVEFCRIVSPVEGIAGISKAQVGDLVGTPGSPPLTSVSTLDPMKLIVPLSEQEYLMAGKRIQEILSKPFSERGKTIEVVLADGQVFPEKARLLSVDRQINQATGTILFTVLLDNPGNLLRPGQFARARVPASVIPDALVVPQRALMEVQGTYQLGIIGPDGKAEIRPVQVGQRLGPDWVITSGLKPGEKVVVEGLQKLRAGQPVDAKPWTPAPQAAPAEQPSK